LFFFHTPATTQTYPLSLHDALPIFTRRDVVVAPSEIEIVGVAATEASAAEWAVMEQLQKRLPDAEVTLREHRLSWRREPTLPALDRKSTRLNSSHVKISYAVFCLKK